ncbi:hypothetical protein KY290_005478 [Solanum tuberosum]|uniref:Transposon MuDR mudrA n=1 Tax=Solanum tuberosum TaxID=4113 RepID=A0ABQ7WE98_SOLTU|nr:hypothetical protein KY289_005868 [Solanum tuberosum]KAH0779051.1 hypothetical protein KY290_005478 [Solanum tuberosum]
MASTIITLQMHYGGCFLSDLELSDAYVLRFINNLKGGDFVDVYVVHQISTPLIVEDPNEVQIAQLLTPKKDQQPRVDKGKNKETAALEKNGYTTGTARTATGGSGGATTSIASTDITGGATSGSGGATTSTVSTGVTVGGSGGAATKRLVTTPATSRGATTAATCTDGIGGAITKRPITTSTTSGGATTAATTTGGSAANISVNFASVAQPTSQFSTQQSTTSASGSKRSSKVKRGGENPGYKRPRTEKPRTTGFSVLFGANGSVIEGSGTTDRVLHCATLKSSVPTNIDIGYKPNGLRWKGGAAVTQRQLQEQSYKRATQSTPSTQDT